jgi:hypothetical protein
MLGLGGWIAKYEVTESVADFGLGGVFTHTYDTDILQVWCISIDMHFILLHVEFEDELFLSVSKYRATCHKSLQLLLKVLKKKKLSGFTIKLFSV